MSFGGSKSVELGWGSNGYICKKLCRWLIIISQEWKSLFQIIFWLELLLTVKSWITDSKLCLLFSCFWVYILLQSFHFVASRSHRRWSCQSYQHSQRRDWEREERKLRSRGRLTLLTADFGAQLEKSQVITSLIFSGSQIISSRISTQLVCSSSKSVKTVVRAEKRPSIHSSNMCCCRKPGDHTPTLTVA